VTFEADSKLRVIEHDAFRYYSSLKPVPVSVSVPVSVPVSAELQPEVIDLNF
jgi:hypothetical protein